jgi:hypothetical protein
LPRAQSSSPGRLSAQVNYQEQIFTVGIQVIHGSSLNRVIGKLHREIDGVKSSLPLLDSNSTFFAFG